MKFQHLASCALAFCAGSALANPVELITNGGFETGSFSGWTVNASNTDTGSCDQGWNVASNTATGCLGVANPMGRYAAYQAFDGNGPQTRTLSQTFLVPTLSAATLSFYNTYAFSYYSLVRTLDVNLVSASGTRNVYHFAAPYSASQTAWNLQSIDMTSFLAGLEGQRVQLDFVSTIPETYTGPAGFGLDNVSLQATPASHVPEPGTLALIGIAMAGLGWKRRR